MQSTAISPTQAIVARTPSTQPKTSLDYDAFLKLLVASMEKQDPTEPNDPSETLSQLASFSNVEQSIKLNSKLDHLLDLSSAGQAASLIGRTATSLDGGVSGPIVSVEISASGLTATLGDGTRLAIAEGVRIS